MNELPKGKSLFCMIIFAASFIDKKDQIITIFYQVDNLFFRLEI